MKTLNKKKRAVSSTGKAVAILLCVCVVLTCLRVSQFAIPSKAGGDVVFAHQEPQFLNVQVSPSGPVWLSANQSQVFVASCSNMSLAPFSYEWTNDNGTVLSNSSSCLFSYSEAFASERLYVTVTSESGLMGYASVLMEDPYATQSIYLDSLLSGGASLEIQYDGVAWWQAINTEGKQVYSNSSKTVLEQWAVNNLTSTGGLIICKETTWDPSVVIPSNICVLSYSAGTINYYGSNGIQYNDVSLATTSSFLTYPIANLTGTLTLPYANMTGTLMLPYANVTGVPDTFPIANLTGTLLLDYGNLTNVPQTFPISNLTGTLMLPYGNLTGTLMLPWANLTDVPQTFPIANLTGVLTLPWGNLTGVPVLLYASGSQALTADWNAGASGTYGIRGLSWINATSLYISDNGIFAGNVTANNFASTQPISDWTYMIYVDPANPALYHAKAQNGTICWSLTNLATVESNAFNAGIGTVFLQGLAYNITLAIPSGVTVTQVIRGVTSVFKSNSLETGNIESYPQVAQGNSVVDWQTVGTGTYDAYGFMARHPDGTLYLFYRNATTAQDDKGSVAMRTSTDNGLSWSNPTFVYTDASFDSRNLGGGITTSGAIIVFMDRYNYTSHAGHDMGFIRSTDEGATWSSYVAVGGVPLYGPLSPYGNMLSIPTKGLMLPYYDMANDASASAERCLWSVDDGLTWSTPQTIAQNATYIVGEGSFTYLGNGQIIGVLRHVETGSQKQPLMQIQSSDYGTTWGSLLVSNLVGDTTDISGTLGAQVSPLILRRGSYLTVWWGDRGSNNQLVSATSPISSVWSNPTNWAQYNTEFYPCNPNYPMGVALPDGRAVVAVSASDFSVGIPIKTYASNYEFGSLVIGQIRKVELMNYTTSITFSGLNFLPGQTYKLYVTTKNPTGSSDNIDIFFNGDLTKANYSSQTQSADSSTMSGSRAADPKFSTDLNNGNAMVEAVIAITPSGYPYYTAHTTYSGARYIDIGGTYSGVVSSITSITLAHNQANGLDRLSEFTLVRVS